MASIAMLAVFILVAVVIVLNIMAEDMDQNPLQKIHADTPFAATVFLLFLLVILYLLKPCAC